jgi:hypothetical protein
VNSLSMLASHLPISYSYRYELLVLGFLLAKQMLLRLELCLWPCLLFRDRVALFAQTSLDHNHLFFFFAVVGLGFMLLGRCSCHLSQSASPDPPILNFLLTLE